MTITARTLAVLLTAVIGAQAASAQTTRLLCATRDGRYPTVHVVDFGATSVDGWKASITESEIKWLSNQQDTLTNREVTYENSINRLNGAYSSWGRGINYSGAPPAKFCEKAPAAKF